MPWNTPLIVSWTMRAVGYCQILTTNARPYKLGWWWWFKVEMGKNTHCLSSVLFGFYQISGFVRFGFYPATEKWKFGSGSVLCAESSVLFGSVLCGFLSIYLVYMFTIYIEYTVYFFIYARLQIFIQLGLSPTVMKSCHIKCDHPACV